MPGQARRGAGLGQLGQQAAPHGVQGHLGCLGVFDHGHIDHGCHVVTDRIFCQDSGNLPVRRSHFGSPLLRHVGLVGKEGEATRRGGSDAIRLRTRHEAPRGSPWRGDRRPRTPATTPRGRCSPATSTGVRPSSRGRSTPGCRGRGVARTRLGQRARRPERRPQRAGLRRLRGRDRPRPVGDEGARHRRGRPHGVGRDGTHGRRVHERGRGTRPRDRLRRHGVGRHRRHHARRWDRLPRPQVRHDDRRPARARRW